MIYGVDGQFGSGKTSFVVWIASQRAQNNTLILTNIKMNTLRIPNVYEFDDKELVSVFRTINLINDMERFVFDEKIYNSNLPYHPREKFTNFVIMLDESGALLNSQRWKENFEEHRNEYVNQNRKNFLDIYLCSADGGQNDKSLRQFVDWWYYSKPFLNFPILEHIKVIRRQKREQDGVKVLQEQYTAMDSEGDFITKERPIDSYFTFYWQPSVWQLYDDLHKNIKDPNKYIGVRMDFVSRALQENKHLLKALKKNSQFQFLLDSPDLFLKKEKKEKKMKIKTLLISDSII